MQPVKFFIAIALMIFLTGCSSPSANQSSGLPSVDGRAVAASNEEITIRTSDGERKFQVRDEDVSAIDPVHIQSHVGVATLGFRIYYRNINGQDYAISVEEIKASTLGFD